MAQLPVLTAVSGSYEAPLVGGLGSGGDVVVVRRCADLADLLAAASSGRARAALVSADLRGLDGEALGRLAAAGLAVVALVTPGAQEQRLRMVALGAGPVLDADAPVADVAAALHAAVAAVEDAGPTRSTAAPSDPSGALRPVGRRTGLAPDTRADSADDDGPADRADALADDSADDRADDRADGGRGDVAAGDAATARGRLVAVWGPVGSPGRTTVAVTLAAELAAAGQATLLADADTYGACVAQTLGVLDEAPGLAAACRAATAGTLDPVMLARLAPVVSPGLRVLTGITRADRWPELSVPGLERVWDVVRSVAAWTVVDTGFSLERDEELSYDTMAPRRNGATLSALEAADVVLAVGAADPVGMQRLVRGLGELTELLPALRPQVVVTRARASSVGAAPERRVREALERYAGVRDVVVVPDDRHAVDTALLSGRTLTETAPGSPARRALADLAAALVGPRTPARSARGVGTRRAG